MLRKISSRVDKEKTQSSIGDYVGLLLVLCFVDVFAYSSIGKPRVPHPHSSGVGLDYAYPWLLAIAGLQMYSIAIVWYIAGFINTCKHEQATSDLRRVAIVLLIAKAVSPILVAMSWWSIVSRMW